MSEFFTTEISSPEFEANGLRFITVKSKALQRRADICVYVPPSLSPGQAPDVVILLHGVYGSHWAWALIGGVHKTAERMIRENKIRPMVLVMPSDGLYGDGSAYLPHHQEDYEQWIVNDVINVVKEQISVVSGQSRIFIAGLSMGGYGALRLGAKYPDVFVTFSGLSSITDFTQMSIFLEGNKDEELRKDVRTMESVLDCMVENRERLPCFRFDCGKEDILIDYNRTLHQELGARKIKHDYIEHPGKHEWVYWKRHIEETLIFFNDFEELPQRRGGAEKAAK